MNLKLSINSYWEWTGKKKHYFGFVVLNALLVTFVLFEFYLFEFDGILNLYLGAQLLQLPFFYAKKIFLFLKKEIKATKWKKFFIGLNVGMLVGFLFFLGIIIYQNWENKDFLLNYQGILVEIINKYLSLLLFIFSFSSVAYYSSDKINKLLTSPGPTVSWLLSIMPFVLVIILWVNKSNAEYEKNEDQTIYPGLSQMGGGFAKTLYYTDVRKEYDDLGEEINKDKIKSTSEAWRLDLESYNKGVYSSKYEMLKKGKTLKFILEEGESPLIRHTWASLRRIGISAIFIILSMFFGLYMGSYRWMEKLFSKFVSFFDKINPVALLAVLVVLVGMAENGKIILIVIGVIPTIIRDTYLKSKQVHDDYIIKGMTFNASKTELVHRIIFPSIAPEVVDNLRLQLKNVIIFLLLAESMAAQSGIGYAIFIAQKSLNLSLIIPLVLWISLIANWLDSQMQKGMVRSFPHKYLTKED